MQWWSVQLQGRIESRRMELGLPIIRSNVAPLIWVGLSQIWVRLRSRRKDLRLLTTPSFTSFQWRLKSPRKIWVPWKSALDAMMSMISSEKGMLSRGEGGGRTCEICKGDCWHQKLQTIGIHRTARGQSEVLSQKDCYDVSMRCHHHIVVFF